MGYGNKKDAIKYIENKINRLLATTKSDAIVLALSDAEHNYRKDIMPCYKGHRKTVKPILYKFIRQYFHDNYTTYERPSLEGDDILGILATSTKIIKGNKAVWSLDKDLSTIPCVFYREAPDGKLTKKITTPQQADWNFMYQSLLGDPTDGYKGCKNIGKARANDILGTPGDYSLEEMWELVVACYEKNEMSKQDALNNARCARILRCEDYDFKNREVKLWTL